jgi:hypothetical protein
VAEHHDDDGITPRLTISQAKELKAVTLDDGRQYFPYLQALKTNSLQGKLDASKLCKECRDSPFLDPGGYDKNRQLAENIRNAVKELKPHDKDGPHFILEWRLYANKDHPRFKNVDGCSCSCGDDSLPYP